MKRNRRLKLLVALVMVVLITAVVFVRGDALVAAQSGGGYDLTLNKIAGGGATDSSGGAYSLGGTIGQADAGAMSGGDYTLGGGFWGGGDLTFITEQTVYLPFILKN